MSSKIRLLFICLGNICRSPSAEAIMQKKVEQSSLKGIVECDSAGTISYHQGKGADERMKHYALKRGYTLASISRPIDPESDFEAFDWIIVMDAQNYQDVCSLDFQGKYTDKIRLMTSWCSKFQIDHVPDPYYGNDGFDLVLDILEDACSGLLEELSS